METERIIETITSIFSGADAHDWGRIKDAMANNVLLDYSSMNGNPASVVPSAKIIEAWKAFLPGFDKTHHQLSAFIVNQQSNLASAEFFGKADHFIGQDSWTVAGTYDTELIRSGNDWQVTKFKFNLLQQSGDTSLPQKAAEIAGRL